MLLKTTKTMQVPEYGKEENAVTRNIFEQIVRLLRKMFTDIYDDLNALVYRRSDALPTASAEWLGRHYVLTHIGASDTLHFCIYRGATDDYAWKQVTLT